MKRIVMMLLAVTMLLALTACNRKNGAQNNTANPTTDAHVHDYSTKETPATCTEKGKETFTCACGHTYSEEIPAIGHNWGEWIITAPALLEKDGTETRTCTVCSATDTKVTKENAVENSFADDELQYVFDRWNGENGDITADGMLFYFSQKHDNREDDPLVVSSAVAFEWLSERFVLTDALKEEMKRTEAFGLKYHADTDTFELSFAGYYGENRLLGYIPNGGNSYTVYYQFSSWDEDGPIDGIWEVKVEYNLPNGQPNRYLSAKKVNTVPDKVVC